MAFIRFSAPTLFLCEVRLCESLKLSRLSSMLVLSERLVLSVIPPLSVRLGTDPKAVLIGLLSCDEAVGEEPADNGLVGDEINRFFFAPLSEAESKS